MYFQNIAKNKKKNIKNLLMDQFFVSGIGNIYACEALFSAGISPRRIASNVKGLRASRLVQSIQNVLLQAIDAGGSSINDHLLPSGDLGYFQHSFNVYDRAGYACPKCNSDRLIKKIKQFGRSTFYCPNCQR